MSLDALQLVGKTFDADQFSLGHIANIPGLATNLFVNDYRNDYAVNNAGFGVNDLTVTGVSTSNGVTTVSGSGIGYIQDFQSNTTTQQIKVSFSGTLAGNDASDFMLSGNVDWYYQNGSGYVDYTGAVYFSNNPNNQPYLFNAVAVPPESDAVEYNPYAVCFASGTRIRVVRDDTIRDVAVEHLVVGDLAVTASNALRPVRWLGHRVVDCARIPEPAFQKPVRIAAHAFGANRPARDLVVSPGHAICVDALGDVLMPAGALVDGAMIVQLDVPRVTYWHVELDDHDILLAENLPVESYLEMGNRGFFVEAKAVALRARPDAPIATHADFCRPFVDSGPRLEAVRARLHSRYVERIDERGDASVAG